ncbi:hypothetical protein [Emticicia sp. BO119]|uniref:hypothetical protein n=1 Tax=Emticicia sp. BO119 TaxID=2757768 RepID=UPI0015F0CB90|nr:hypothetical protein [Emticicia sp. BO119]MBA4848972.1 hypothetical protein [Emticicia sp. BO119]
MIEIVYTCTLETDIVLNAKLATEGNMETLDFIPGSNFLGIVANNIYKNYKPDEAYDMLHSNKVLFGDAHISNIAGLRSYAMPLVLFKDKLDKSQTWVQYEIDEKIDENLRLKNKQLKQERIGYISESGIFFKDVKKNFALKSAQDRSTRSSAEGQMFGVSSLAKGQVFTFAVKYASEDLKAKVEAFLIGKKQIGKSKTAQFGQVNIQPIDVNPVVRQISNNGYHIIYAESNLCFFNESGHPTFQPSANDLGIDGGEICWEKSQVRTYSYAPWNFKRNTPNTQRHCIQKGSVFYIKGGTINNPYNVVGEYTNEGLGRVIYNPAFLKAKDDATWDFSLTEPDDNGNERPNAVQIGSMLGLYLKSKKEESEKEVVIAKSVHEAVYGISNENPKNITASQWGSIRAEASKCSSVFDLHNLLFDKEKGILTSGVSAKKYWDKSRNREKLEAIIKANCLLGTVFVTRYAEEMAKKSLKPNKENGK